MAWDPDSPTSSLCNVLAWCIGSDYGKQLTFPIENVSSRKSAKTKSSIWLPVQRFVSDEKFSEQVHALKLTS